MHMLSANSPMNNLYNYVAHMYVYCIEYEWYQQYGIYYVNKKLSVIVIDGIEERVSVPMNWSIIECIR
jgi:hypothetical protein